MEPGEIEPSPGGWRGGLVVKSTHCCCIGPGSALPSTYMVDYNSVSPFPGGGFTPYGFHSHLQVAYGVHKLTKAHMQTHT